MTNGLRLRSYLLAAAASLGLGAITPASAITIPEPDPSAFAIVETVSGGIGTFTIYNMSSDRYIYAFSVVNIIGRNQRQAGRIGVLATAPTLSAPLRSLVARASCTTNGLSR
jgi:hypothetical protein